MTLRRAKALLLVLPALAIAGASLPIGCSGQGEGERCDTKSDNSGNDDCAGDLVCTPSSQFGGRVSVDICCPSDRTKATTPICSPQVGGTDGGGVTPFEAGADTGVVDSATDAPTIDAPVTDAADASDAVSPVDASDAGTDGAIADAPADG